MTWDQRLEALRQFKLQKGRFPSNKEGTIGNWLKNQRKLYTKKDADFMVNRRAKVSKDVYFLMYRLGVYLEILLIMHGLMLSSM